MTGSLPEHLPDQLAPGTTERADPLDRRAAISAEITGSG
jgi:hypothetical protein